MKNKRRLTTPGSWRGIYLDEETGEVYETSCLETGGLNKTSYERARYLAAVPVDNNGWAWWGNCGYIPPQKYVRVIQDPYGESVFLGHDRLQEVMDEDNNEGD